MAADKITIDLDLNARKAQREVAALQKKIDALGKSMSKGLGGIGGGGSTDKVRALGTGLSKATVRADEFSKSLEASNARVIAFGASAGLIMQVDKALKAMVTSAIKVEKAMMDVNIVMNANAKTLDQFGKGMFKVAKETAQGFDTVAEAATELARQGLGMEKTLTRTKDALILTRLTGMNAADAVKSLTAAVNSFNKEGVTSAQVVNRMAKVDAAFAVSSEDLAKSISRVGASAQSAGVSMNELMAITTAVQQRTARGGAVIGNAFKTIFTRIQRSDVQQKLENLGVATRSMSGEMLSGIQILQNLAKNFDNLSRAQQSSTAESVAGVFQVNILRSALGDLAQKNSAYAGALRAANSATDEAYQKNEKLNQTLDALVNRTLANLTKAGASLGGDLFGPAINNALGAVNGLIEAFGEGGKLEKFGEGFGKDMLQGLGKFIGGPGLILVTAAFGKLALNLGKFATTALKDFMGLNAAVKQRAALEEMVIDKLRQEPDLVQQIAMKETTVLDIQREILRTMELQTAERAQMQAIATPVARGMYSAGARVTPSGFGAFGRGTPRRNVSGLAGGFIPNFASAGAERAAAAAGGYQAGAIRTMSQPGTGTMMYNSAETVKQFPGMSQKAIMPPQNSVAGAGYKAAFGAAHGFDPYAAGGFVPNFNRTGALFTRSRATRESMKVDPKRRGAKVDLDLTLPASQRDIGVITETGTDTTPIRFSQNIMNPKEGIPALSKTMSQWKGADGRGVGKASLRVSGIPVVPIFPISKQNETGGGRGPTSPGTYLQNSLNRYSKRLAMEMFGDDSGLRRFDVKTLSQGTMGDIFEEGVRTAVGGAENDDRLAAFDYMGKRYANSKLIGFFNRQGRSANLTTKSKIEAKIGTEAAVAGNIPKKMINDPNVGYDKKEVLELFKGEFLALTAAKGGRSRTPMAASGFVPNFSALSSAVAREVAAGVPASAIRVGSSPALRSAGNPGGVGVYNTIHEPAGLNQGINRSKAAGVDPKTHGFVPNFFGAAFTARRSLGSRLLGYGAEAGKTGLGLGGMMLGSAMYNSEGAVGRVLGSTAMGAIGGVPGAIGGFALGALTEVINALMSSSDDTTDALKQQVEAQNEAGAAAKESALAFAEVAESLSAAEFVTRKEKELKKIEETHPEMVNTREHRRLKSASRENFEKRSEDFFKQADRVKRFSSAVENFEVPSFTQKRENRRTIQTSRKGNVTEAKRQAQKLFELLAAQGITPAARMDELVAGGATLEDLKGFKGTAAQALGMSSSQYSKVTSKLKESFGPEAVQVFDQQVIKKFNSERAFRAAEDRAEKTQEEINEENEKGLANQKSYNETILKAMQAQERYRQTVHEAERALGTMTRDAAQERAMFGLASGLRIAQAGARQDSLGVAFVVRQEAREAAELERENAVGIADKAVEVSVMQGLKGMNAVKFIEGGGFSGEEAGKALDAFTNLRDSIELGSDQAQINSLIKKLAGIKGMKLEEGIMFGEESAANQVGLGQLKNIIDTLTGSQEKYNKAIDAATEGEKNAKALAEEQFRVTKETIKQQYQINLSRRKELRAIQASVAALELAEAESLMKTRKLGARGRNAAFSASLAADVRNRGVQKGDMGRAFRAGFINEFGYEPADQLEDFEKSSRQVAQTMKSSFADAFRSIASGASTAGEAIAMMAQSILDSISQVSTNMFTNMMFARMSGQSGLAQGGYIPGYNSGGLITGGSGYKDDVPIHATGGEFVIKKSAVNKIGVPTLNAINGMANGGPSLGKVGMIAAGASAASGLLGAAMQPGTPDPAPSQNYGFGRSKHGYLGGADPDVRGPDMISGGSGRASASLNKAYVYYRRDPQTGQLISERARPTEGRFEVSDRLSLLGRLGEDDPQTARMFQKEEAMSNYQGYLAQETSRRKAAVKAVERKKRGNLIQGYANAAMLIGGAYMMDKMTPPAGTEVMMGSDGKLSSFAPGASPPTWTGSEGLAGFKSTFSRIPKTGKANGGMIAAMGGEYVMSPEAVRTHGINFMTELNRGNVPGYASGGLVGAPPAAGGGSMVGGSTTNNVSINVNIDKNGKASTEGSATSQKGGPSERDERQEVEDNKQLGEVLQGVVLQEIVRQQRPGGLLNNNTTGVS